MIEEGGTSGGIEMVAAELVAKILRKGVGGFSLVGPVVFERFQAVEGYSGWEGNVVGSAWMEMPQIDVGELAFPELAQGHFTGIECQIDPFGVTHADAAVADRALAAAHFRNVADAKFVGLAGETEGLFGARAVCQIRPEGFDLLCGVTSKDVGSRGFSVRPVAGHDDGGMEARGLAHVKIEPIFIEPLRHMGNVQRADLA